MAQPSHLHIGKLGEDIAVFYLKKHGFTVVERNYRKKWGELDVVVKKDNILHFVEVKTTSRMDGMNVRPEENMHAWKRERLARTVATYLSERHIPEELEWTFDLITVYLQEEIKRARVSVLKDIVLE